MRRSSFDKYHRFKFSFGKHVRLRVSCLYAIKNFAQHSNYRISFNNIGVLNDTFWPDVSAGNSTFQLFRFRFSSAPTNFDVVQSTLWDIDKIKIYFQKNI